MPGFEFTLRDCCCFWQSWVSCKKIYGTQKKPFPGHVLTPNLRVNISGDRGPLAAEDLVREKSRAGNDAVWLEETPAIAKSVRRSGLKDADRSCHIGGLVEQEQPGGLERQNSLEEEKARLKKKKDRERRKDKEAKDDKKGKKERQGRMQAATGDDV